MDVNKNKKHAYVRRFKRHSNQDLYQMAIIFAFIFISTLISILLPIYFAALPLHGS
jgi:hypothetical protein